MITYFLKPVGSLAVSYTLSCLYNSSNKLIDQMCLPNKIPTLDLYHELTAAFVWNQNECEGKSLSKMNTNVFISYMYDQIF